METKRINIGQLTGNTGQIPGLPANPRTWTKTEREKAEREKAEVWELSEKEYKIIERLNKSR
jgi:hypothetical protein